LAIGPSISDPLWAMLDRLGLGDFYDLLVASNIDASAIDVLTEADLRELGLTVGQRKRFLRARRRTPAEHAVLDRREAPGRDSARAAERRQLTTLFCDLVDSTRLSTILDPEDLHDVMEAYQAICASVVHSHNGHVAFYQGDGVMAYFGFPFAREDDPERAVRAAFEISEKIRELKTVSPSPLRTRIGIATGIVVVGDRDPLVTGGNIAGETPNLAARLQDAGGPGEVVISEATRRLCGALFDYEARGNIILKGFPEPVTIHRVLGESAAQSRFEARARVWLNPIVGRDAELDTLARLWRGARSGAGQVALVCGEAGIGKSRLTRAFIEQLGQQMPEILRLDCAAHLANRALHPIVREMERRIGLSRTAPADTRRAALEARVANSSTLGANDVSFLADLLGIVNDKRAELDAATRARRTYDVLARAVEGMSHAGPVLILVEDTHWADAATLDFLTMLIDRIERLPIMLLMTYRPDSPPPWADAPGHTTITLNPLDAVAGAQLLGSVLGDRKLPASVSQTILERAGGVPLFVEELARTVIDAAQDRGGDSDAFAALTIPATLHDSLMARLDQLGPVKELAQIGSVIGREFNAAMLQAIAPHHPDIVGGLRHLRDSGLADEAGRGGVLVISFHHALVQDTAYESLLRKRRRELHRVVAEAMLAQQPAFAGAEPEVIARHCSRGGLAEPAVSHWLAAGLHALDRAANLPALAHLRAALEDLREVPPSPARSKTELAVQMALAPASMAIHGWASSQVAQACSRAKELATQLDDPESMFGAAWGLWTHYFLRGEMELALAAAQSVDAMANAEGTKVKLLAADHAVGFTQYFRGELTSAVARAQAGVARFDEETERQIVRMFQFSSTTALHSFAAAALWKMGREAEADAALARSLALAERLAHAPSLVFSLAFNSFVLLHRGDWSRVRENSLRTIALSEEEGFQMWLPLGQLFIGLCDAAEGRVEPGLTAALDAFERFAATGTGVCQSNVHAPIGEFLIAAGRAREVVQRLDLLIASATRRREAVYLSELYRVRGLAHHALGVLDLARADIAAACNLSRLQGAVTLLRRAEETQRSVLGGDGRQSGFAEHYRER
jgi:class 3 adenylate cyclase